MKTIKTIIIDDDSWTHEILNKHIKDIEEVNCTKNFYNPIEALTYLKTNPDIQLILLDIEMPEINGFHLMNLIPYNTHVILISSEEKYALKAFEYNVIDYLLKPITFNRFKESIQKIKFTHPSCSEKKDHFFIKEKGVLRKLTYSKIILVSIEKDYLEVKLIDNQKIIFLGSLSHLEKQLPSYFTRVHRSHLINLKRIDRIEDSLVYLLDFKVPIGRMYQTSFKAQIEVYRGKPNL